MPTGATNPSGRKKFVGIISKPAKPELSQILPELFSWFEKHEYRVVIDRETAAYSAGPETIDRKQMATLPLDFVVVLGGDGTLLSKRSASCS